MDNSRCLVASVGTETSCILDLRLGFQSKSVMLNQESPSIITPHTIQLPLKAHCFYDYDYDGYLLSIEKPYLNLVD